MATGDKEARLDGSSVDNRKGSYAASRVTATSRITIAEPQNFQWIPVQGDPTARRRARAHISRGFRRKKVFDEQQSRDVNKDNAGSTSSSSSGFRTEKQPTAISAESFPPNRSHDVIDIRSAQNVIEHMMLKRTLGIGGGSRADDPFQCFPVELSHSDQAILDHYLFVYAPGSLTAESRASFQGFKIFSFESSLQHPSAFHVVLALGASHIAVIGANQESEASIKHRWMAIKTVNETLSKRGAAFNDTNFASVALLARLELMFGCPRNFNIHMLDMVAACNLYSKRRFGRPKPPDASPEQAPEEKAPKPEPRLPPGYDMTQVLPDLFKGLGTVTSVIKGVNATEEERLESSSFISEMDSKLFGLTCRPDRTGNTSRRHHLNQTFPIVVLIYVTFISGYEIESEDKFFSHFEEIIDDETEAWGRPLTKIFKLLLAGVAFESGIFAIEMSSLIEACTKMDWEAMRDVKIALSEFFVKDPACKGQLQDLWKNRITGCHGF